MSYLLEHTRVRPASTAARVAALVSTSARF